MRILGLETSSAHGSVALTDGGKLVAFEQTSEPNAHAESLSSAVRRLTARVGWKPADVEVVAVGRGPGSFTGLRVGIALAQGIGAGLGIPVVGVPSLAALAHAVPADLSGWRVPAIDARRGELFVAVYAPNGESFFPATLIARAALNEHVRQLGGVEFILCGEGELVGVDDNSLVPVLASYPRADATAAIAERWVIEQSPMAAEAVTPLYLRDADATVPELRPNPLLQATAEFWQVGAHRSEGST